VQGFGAVGRHAARFLTDKGARLVAASDSRGIAVDRDGLDLAKLAALKEEGRSVADYPAPRGPTADDILDVECDIWIPAARPDVVIAENVARLKTRLVAQGANIPVTEAAERALHERGVLSIPDFIANAGGVICGAMEYAGAGEQATLEAIAEKIRANTTSVLERAQADGVTPREAAVALAGERVRKAMAFRRWSTY
jgi:glutamate dehydrogenase (NAD(P)+)